MTTPLNGWVRSRVTLDDPVAQLDRVTDGELGHVLTDLLLLDRADDVHGC